MGERRISRWHASGTRSAHVSKGPLLGDRGKELWRDGQSARRRGGIANADAQGSSGRGTPIWLSRVAVAAKTAGSKKDDTACRSQRLSFDVQVEPRCSRLKSFRLSRASP